MTFLQLNRAITRCDRCPRLRRHCARIATVKRAAFAKQRYWGRPVPNLAPPDPLSARLLIVGLAPAAHGANRTGRVFTGDRSGDFLFRAMHETGFATQATSTHAADGLELIDCAITAVCHCAPPDNKPTPAEIRACGPFLEQSLELLPNVRVVLALGRLAFDSSVALLQRQSRRWAPDAKVNQMGRRPAFFHGALYGFESADHARPRIDLLAAYHPSQQNTFTGRLTAPMLRQIFAVVRRLIVQGRPGPKATA